MSGHWTDTVPLARRTGPGCACSPTPALWGAHHDLTGPVPLSWPEALEQLSAELGEPVTFRVAAEQHFRAPHPRRGTGTAELLITRECDPRGENHYTTGIFQQITGPPPAPGSRVPPRYRAEFT